MLRRRELDQRVKDRIIEMHQKEKMAYQEISKVLTVRVSTIRKVILKVKGHGTTKCLSRSGRPSKISQRAEWMMRRAAVGDLRTTSVDHQANLQEHDARVSASTVRRHLIKKGLFGRVARKKPLLSSKHRKARLEFAKKYADKDLDFWKSVLWTDETKLEL